MNSTPFAVLIGRALAHVARRAPLYAALSVAAIAVEWLVYRYTHAPGALAAGGIVVTAAVDTVVLAEAQGDVDGSRAPQIWSRVLERLWAVVVVNFVATYIALYGIALLIAGDFLDRIAAIPVLLLSVMMIFAETVAVTTEEEPWWFLVVRAIGTSIRTTWSGATLTRAIALFTLQFVPVAIASAVTSALARNHVTLASFWSDVPLGILFSIPLDALIVLAFFDASGYEPKHTCGE